MVLFCFFLVAATATPTRIFSPLPVTVALATNGSFTLSVGGSPYFSSAAIFVRSDGRFFSTVDGSLAPAGAPSPPAPGSDALGAFTRQEITWVGDGTSPLMVTAINTYPALGAVSFETSFPRGLNGTAAPQGADATSTGWPSFALDASDADRGVVGFGGRFLEASHATAWSAAAGGELASAGQHGGPMVVFNKALSVSVAVSSLSAHPVTISAVDKASAALSYGLLGSVTSAPAGFTLRVIVAATAGGPTAAALRWGGLVTTYGGAAGKRIFDNSTRWLGYATDNGAYYYYNTQKDPNTGKPLNYQDTLLNVLVDEAARGVPIKYLQLDSWWYTQGKGGGVSNWSATEKTFPNGLRPFFEQVSMPFYAHNRYWAADNVYATQNGGDYEFIVEPGAQMAIPLSQRFWDDLLRNATQWGMNVYEQDWLYNEAEGLNATRESATLTELWLTQMATAAEKLGVAVQYCMSLPRFVMMAAQLPAVTQVRAGDDYGPGQTATCSFPYCVYYIHTSSLLAWALGIAPSKDDWWSSTVQPGSPYGRGNATEPYPSMEAAIAILSTAPVQISDGVGFTNATLALATCTAGGRLLQPSRPATAIDACFAADAFGAAAGPAAAKAHNLPVMSTHTNVGGRLWAHVLTISLAADAALAPDDLPLDVAPLPGDGGLLAYAGWREAGGGSFSLLGPWSAAAPIKLPAAPDAHQWTLTHAAPVLANGWALLGEAAKLVPVAVARVTSVGEGPGGEGVAVVISGEPGEAVVLSFAEPVAGGGLRVVAVQCTLGAAGVATVTVGPSRGGC